MEKKNVLIINYVFPPYPGIGGRRWAKFAKYLHRRGHKVYVIAAQNPFDYESTFIEDIKELPKENLFYLPSLYPQIMISPLKSVWDKLKYQFWYRVLPFFTNGNYYDRSMFWKKQLQSKIEELIQSKNIQTILVTGPPFHYVYYTLQLKDKYPNVKFIVDYRDEWTFNGVHGIDIIGEKRKQKEIEKEKFVCEKADKVITCHRPILEYLKTNYSINSYELIMHSYDKEDFIKLKLDTGQPKNQFILSIYGTFEEERFLRILDSFLIFLKKQKIDLYQKIFINFYLLKKNYLLDKFDHKNKIQIHYNLNPSELFNKLLQSNYIIVATIPKANYFTSKFPEIFYLRKPILFFSEKGLVSEFIEQYKIGVHLTENNFNEKFLYALQHPEAFSYESFPIEEWSYEYRTDKLERLL